MSEAAPNKKEAKQGSGDENQSMEEILQSIRSIIAEDGEGSNGAAKPEAAPTAASSPAKTPASAPAVNGTKEVPVPGSSVLELTEMLKEDGTVESLKAPAPAEVPKEPAPAAPASEPASSDVLNKIDEALAVSQPVAAAATPPASEAPVQAPAADAPAAPKTASANDTLLSDQAALATAASFKKLKVEEPMPPLVTTPSPAFTSGATVETMVVQMLKPMVKDWLDTNLPAIVERIVEREVKKLSRQ
jgi:uncharacterized protein